MNGRGRVVLIFEQIDSAFGMSLRRRFGIVFLPPVCGRDVPIRAKPVGEKIGPGTVSLKWLD